MNLRFTFFLSVVLGMVLMYMLAFELDPGNVSNSPPSKQSSNKQSLDSGYESTLIESAGYELVKINCLGCHSDKLITQNRATREGWESTIRWMQKTQNLWDLGDSESIILDYLAENYAPQKRGRRAPLQVEWYDLSE